MMGRHDGFLISDLPSSASGAALSFAAAATGAVTNLESHEICDGAAQAQVVKGAKTASAAYKPSTA